jgi:predicted DNA-binding transcriptional regulator AlpA
MKQSTQTAPSRKVLFIEDLVRLIGKTATTIRTCATNQRYQHLIPRPWKMPNSRRLCWFEDEVLHWIESGRPAIQPPTKRPRGRPTKAEHLARQRWQATAAPEKGGGQ